MDEFKDLEREILKLKKELDLQGENGSPFQAPEISDYWKRRLDEEKILMSKKMATREEEKKALELKLSQQQSMIEQYTHSLKDLEKKLELETKQWEDRLRLKEADLLIEKNRMFSEEKVKEAEFENRKLLVDIAELNGKINKIKDEHLIEIDRLNENFGREREVYEEKLAARLKEIEGLRARCADLENVIKAKGEEIDQVREEHALRLKQEEDRTAALAEEKNTVEKAKITLAGEVLMLKNLIGEERRQAETFFKTAGEHLVQNLYKHIGPLVSLVQFAARHRVAPSTKELFNDLVQKLDGETDAFVKEARITYAYAEPFTVVAAVPERDFLTWSLALKKTKAAVQRLEVKALSKEVARIKPQVVIVAAKYLRQARALRRQWPFLPVIIAGSLEASRVQKLAALGFTAVVPPYINDDLAAIVSRTAAKSIALPAYWGRIKVQRSFALPLAVVALLAAGALLFPFRNRIAVPLNFDRAASFSTPYPQPTNLTYDGQYLWTCDWFGQSIYKHSTSGGLKLERIFYFPAKHFTALAWAGGYLWSVDPWEGKIYKHNADASLTILASYPATGSAATGLAGDGNALWSCDAAAGRIYRHKLDDQLTVEAIYKSPGTSPSGLCFDGQTLWSVDAKTNRIYRHNLDEQLTVKESYLAPEHEQKGYTLSGIAAGPKAFWLCSEKTGKIYRYAFESLRKVNEQ